MEKVEIKRIRSTLNILPGAEEFLISLKAFARKIEPNKNQYGIFVPCLIQDPEIESCKGYKLSNDKTSLILTRFDNNKSFIFTTLDEFKKFLLQEIE